MCRPYAPGMGAQGAPGDGRLELDDLGDIIDRSTSLDSPVTTSAEVLEGVESPSLGERLHDAGITPWLRRHRVAVAVVTAVAVLGAAGATTYVRTRPVPEDTVMALGVVDTDPTSSFNSSPVMSFNYTVTPQRPGEKFRVLGIDGPGVRASSASVVNVTDETTGEQVVSVNALPGCDDPAVAVPDYRAYHLRVERTDALGRVLDGVVDVPGDTTARWPDQVIGLCLQQWLTEGVRSGPATVTIDPRALTLRISAQVQSSLGRDLSVDVFNQGGSVNLRSITGTITADATSQVDMSFGVDDCAQPAWGFSQNPTDGRPIDGMPISTTYNDNALVQSFIQGYVLLQWDHATQRRIESAVASMCAGRPSATTTVLSSRQIIDRELEANGVNRGIDPAIVLRSRVDLRSTTATHVQLADTLTPFDLRNGSPPLIRTVASDLRDGHAVLTFDWVTSCAAQSNPPQVQLTLRAGGREWPVRQIVDSAVLARAYQAACPGMTDLDLTNMGWTVAGSTPTPVPQPTPLTTATY